MPTLADENEFARICLYGKYGMGKTTALASAAKLGAVVHVDRSADSGSRSIESSRSAI